MRQAHWLVFLFAFILYANTLNHQFALDDYSLIHTHSHVQNGIEGIDEILTSNYRNGNGGFNDGLYRPLSLVTFALEKEWWNSNPSIGHLINVLLYALASLFLYRSIRQLFSKESEAIPLLITLLFVSHPIHTEVVANIKGRDEIMAYLGFSLMLYFLLHFLNSRKPQHLLLSSLSFLFALFSKESAVTYALGVPVLAYLLPDIRWKKLLAPGLVFTLLALAFIALRTSIINSMPNAVDPGNFGLLNNPIAVESSFTLKWGSTFALQSLFIGKLLFPFSLLHDYSYSQLPLVALGSWQALLGIFLLLTIISLSCWGLLKKHKWGLIVCFYFLSISVASQLLLPIGVQFAERLLFMPSLAFCMLVPLLLSQLFNKSSLALSAQARYLNTFLLLLIFTYSVQTFARNKDWKNNLSLYEADIEKGKESARVNYNLGSTLNEQAQLSTNPAQKKQLLQRSATYLLEAIRIYPDYQDAYNNLGLVYKNAQNYQKAQTVYKALIQKKPEYSKAYYNLATTLFADEQYQEAIRYMLEYTRLKPNSANAYFIMGQAAGNLQQFDRAVDFLGQAVKIQPDFVDAYNYLGMALGTLQQNSAAENSFLTALRYAPNRTDVLFNLAISYKNTGNREAEIATLQKILQINPNHSAAKKLLQQ
jgi:tetratricopeptide (TPR) repeat protein